MKVLQVHVLFLLICAIVISGCSGRDGFHPSSTLDQGSQGTPPSGPELVPPSQEEPTQPVTPNPPPPIVPPPSLGFIPLLWEAVRIESKMWSQFVLSLLTGELRIMLKEVKDMGQFCPNFARMSEIEKANVMAMLISGVAKYESEFNPTRRFREVYFPKNDTVTGKPVYSEGLLQLSYQDIIPYPFCRFDWKRDRALSQDDPKKTILDPIINLDCGLRILAAQVHRTGKIVLARSEGVYWSTLQRDGSHEKIKEISYLVQSQLQTCRETK